MLKISPVWILIASLHITGPALAVDLHQEPLVSVSPGEAATLHCTFGEHMSRERLVWYKYKPGQTLRQVGSVMGQVLTQPEFEKLGIKLELNRSSFSLTIPRTTKDDEGMYFCGKSQGSLLEFTTGTFLAVTGHPEGNISVLQTPVQGSVSPGEPVTLQCTVLSEIRAVDLRVLWFRAAAGQSFPEIIYTHQNSSSRQCEISSSTHSSVYNFSRNILNHHHTGTYYCAVAACGRVIFGNGTAVKLVRPVDPVVMCLGAALGMCVFVISAQAILLCKIKSDHSSVSHQRDSGVENPTRQDSATVELLYSAKSLRMKNGRSGDSVYSEVRYFTLTDLHQSH